MKITFNFRLFDVDRAWRTETPTLVAEFDGAMWEMFPEQPDAFADEFERYVSFRLMDFNASPPPVPQSVNGSIVVVLDELLIDVVEDDVMFRYEVDIATQSYDEATGWSATATCRERVDVETGLPAERTISDERIADGMRRCTDDLERDIDWIDVVDRK